MKSLLYKGSGFGRSLFFCVLASGFSSCSMPMGPLLQPQINSLVVSGRLDQAAEKISAQAAHYGPGNYLLYYLDRGLVEHYAGRYQDSTRSFEKARLRFQEMYTTSLSREAGSWAFNDYALPYRGSDYEYVLLNVFQALNYLAMGDVNEALVEARDMDAKFSILLKDDGQPKRRRFEDDGFARLLMALIAEGTGRFDDRQSALLFYKQALQLYKAYNGGTYIPLLLKQRLLALGHKLSDPLISQWRGEFGLDLIDESGLATIVVLQLTGFSPLKVAQVFPIPLDRTLITQIALPKFNPRYYDVRGGRVLAVSEGGERFELSTEAGVNIEDLAIRDLESRKAAIISKAALRPALKYIIENKQKEGIEKRYGRTAGDLFGMVSSLYNLYSEQADLRSWQALPAAIRVARFALPPGRYHLYLQHLGSSGNMLEETDLGWVTALSDRSVFVVTRSSR